MNSSPATTPALGNEMFVHNMRALWRADAVLAARVDEVPDERRLPVEAAKAGDWTVCTQIGDGPKVYLHSRYNPRAEASKLADGVEFEEKYCFIIGGFGLGYHVLEVFERMPPDALLVVCEPSLELLSTALATVDLSDLLASPRFILLVDDDKARLHEALMPHNSLMMQGMQFVTHPPSERLAGDFHARMRRAITDFVSYTRTTLVTLVHNSQITCRNIAYNLPTYLATPPIEILKDRFAGCPGMVVAAGPSLWKNISLLGEVPGRCVMCCVQTMLKPLLSRGIRPDFVTSLDFHEMSRRFFEGIDDFAGIHLVTEPKATWHVLDIYSGPISVLDNSFAHMLIGAELASRGGLPPGATVAHLAFYLARYMGCDPIIFVGQDLAYTGHVFYVPGVEVHSTWTGEINRFNSMETKEWERIVRNRPILRQITDVNGDPVYTDDLLFTYLEQFEKDFIGCPARLIDATGGGARMRGTEVMPLREVLDQCCRVPIDPQRFAYRTATKWWHAARLEPARDQIAKRLEEIRELHGLCSEFLEVLADLQTLTNDVERFNRRLARVDELRARVQRLDRAYRIINSAAQLAELQRFSADLRIERAEKSGPQRAIEQLKRDVKFVTGTREAAVAMEEILTESLARFDAAMARGSRT